MFRTLDRYVWREILPPMLLALLIFTFLLALPPFMQHLENLLAKGVSFGTIARLIWTLVPQALGLTIPMALLVGILIGFGRLSADRESVALLACGVSPYRLLRPVLALAVACAAVTMYVMIIAIPQANRAFLAITFDIISKRVETDVRPRVFFEDFPGWVLYAGDEAPPGEAGWRRLLVADSSHANATEIYFANRGRLVIDRHKRTVDLVLHDGMRYTTGKPGLSDTLRFEGDLLVGLNPEAVFPQVSIQKGPNERTIAELRAEAARKAREGISPHPEIIALQQKFSFPVACLVFGIIGLALGMTVARDGKLAGFVVGVVVIFAYYVVMFMAESLTKGQYLNAHLSRWVPNLILGAVRRRGARLARPRHERPIAVHHPHSLHSAQHARCPTRIPTRRSRQPLPRNPSRRASSSSSEFPASRRRRRTCSIDTWPGHTCGLPPSRSWPSSVCSTSPPSWTSRTRSSRVRLRRPPSARCSST